MKRFASTRSDDPDSQSAPGRAQWSVGSIDADGIRYGFTTHALSASTIATANTIVSAQSSADRCRFVRFGKRRSSGPRIAVALRDGGSELASDQRHRVEVVVGEVLEHDAVVTDLLDLSQPADHLIDRADGAEVAVALERLLGSAAEASAHPTRCFAEGGAVLAGDVRRHQRAAKRGGVAAGARACLVQPLFPLAGVFGRREGRVVLVGEADG